ncbi:MAG: hypothetical protein APF77_17840 [Clostridia bacterium BRH_c25]|nr:MAG: hypothetical protein APF77_17840 [Clostridia bacterium BRH_c25]
MRITLRKRDSVTSAVLFIFNMIGQYKNEYSIKLSHLLELMQYFNKSEASVRTGLCRMVKANILVNKRVVNETIYELTEEGLVNIRLWNKDLARFFKRHELRQQDWNGQWYFLSILDFNKSEYENLFMLEELEKCGLSEVNNSIWITPYDIDNDIILLLEKHKFNYLKFSGAFESNVNLHVLLSDTFQLRRIGEKYIEFIDKVRENSEKMNAVNKGNILPILFETGWDFYDIATLDPVLPKELLNVWEGDKAADEMKMIRSELYSKIVSFFEEVNI